MSTLASTTPETGTYSIDPSHSSVEFSARHMMVTKVKGRFSDVSGTITVGADHAAHLVEATIAAGSIDTREGKRDEHLRSPEFLDVDNFKEITYRSTAIRPDGEGWKLDGDLTIKGVTKPITLDLTFEGAGRSPFGHEVAGFTAVGTLSRKAFGMEFNVPLDGGGVLVSDKVELTLDVEAIKQVAAA